MEETFADSITGLIFDGQTLRIEFGVTRFDDMKPNAPITGRRYPACRLVLPPAAAVDLINRMQQIAAALTQAGVVKAAPPPGAAPAQIATDVLVEHDSEAVPACVADSETVPPDHLSQSPRRCDVLGPQARTRPRVSALMRRAR